MIEIIIMIIVKIRVKIMITVVITMVIIITIIQIISIRIIVIIVTNICQYFYNRKIDSNCRENIILTRFLLQSQKNSECILIEFEPL